MAPVQTRDAEAAVSMSKRILITFGGKAYDRQVEKQAKLFLCHPVASGGQTYEHRVYDDRWLIGTPFYQLNRWIFERQPQHGFGFCSWKPYIIQHALRSCARTGDVVMYLDADTYPIADISCIFDLAERDGIVLFEEQGCINRTWIKADCFEAMGVDALHWTAYHDAVIACGRFQLFRKDDWEIEQFLQEWLTYSLNPRCMFHEGSFLGGDDPSFIRNSCEQSVLSILAHRYGVPLHRSPDQCGWPVAHNGTYKPEDAYPQLFVQDGARGNVADLSGSRFRNIV